MSLSYTRVDLQLKIMHHCTAMHCIRGLCTFVLTYVFASTEVLNLYYIIMPNTFDNFLYWQI